MRAGHLLSAILLSSTCWGNEQAAPVLPVAEATAEVKAAALTGMKAADYLPAGTDNYLIINTAAWRKIKEAMGESTEESDWPGIESIAIGVPSQTCVCIDSFTDGVATFANNFSSIVVMNFWQLIAHEQVAQLQKEVTEQLKYIQPQDAQKLAHDFPHLNVYVAVQLAPDREDTRQKLTQAAIDNDKELIHINGWHGLSIPLTELAEEIELTTAPPRIGR